MYESILKILGSVKTQIISEYNQLGLKASGSFENNISVGRQGRYKVVLTLPFYAEYITKFKSNKGGRGPGPIKDLQDVIGKWIRDKGFPLRDYLSGQFMTKSDANVARVAFLIGRKIKKEGTDIKLGKRKPIDLDAIINERLDYAGNELADRILQQIKL